MGPLANPLDSVIYRGKKHAYTRAYTQCRVTTAAFDSALVPCGRSLSPAARIRIVRARFPANEIRHADTSLARDTHRREPDDAGAIASPRAAARVQKRRRAPRGSTNPRWRDIAPHAGNLLSAILSFFLSSFVPALGLRYVALADIRVRVILLRAASLFFVDFGPCASLIASTRRRRRPMGIYAWLSMLRTGEKDICSIFLIVFFELEFCYYNFIKFRANVLAHDYTLTWI